MPLNLDINKNTINSEALKPIFWGSSTLKVTVKRLDSLKQCAYGC